MKTTIDIPEDLYKRAKIHAVQKGQTFREVVLVGLEQALMSSSSERVVAEAPYWSRRKLLPEYKQVMKKKAFQGGVDSSLIIDEERGR